MRNTIVFLVVTLTACSPSETGPEAVLTGMVVAGPVCPVESQPPDPNCAPRPVAGAVLELVDESGRKISVTSGPDGRFAVEVRVGVVEVIPRPVEGLMGTAEPFSVSVEGGGTDLGVITYDTGIR